MREAQVYKFPKKYIFLIDNSPIEDIVEENGDFIQEKLDEFIQNLPSYENDTDYKTMKKSKPNKHPMKSRSKIAIATQLAKDIIYEYVE